MNIITYQLTDIKPYDNNPRNNEEAVQYVANSIQEFGFKVPIVIDKDGVIVAGHTRYKAAQQLGLDKVPCIVADDLTPEQIKAFRLADNKTAEIATWDFEKLSLELNELEMYEMSVFGFDEEEETEIESGDVIEDDFEAEIDEETEPNTKYGDIWQLGKHRLICGDSTEKATIQRLMNGERADMVFTDPPYGVCAVGGRTQTKQRLQMKEIENDNLQGDELTEFLSASISAMPYKEKASIYICYPWTTQEEFTRAIKQNGLSIKNCIIWDKKVFGLNGHTGYRPQYEMIYFCCKEGYIWHGDKAQSNIWQVSREIKRSEQGNHPTPKPIELIGKALKNSSKKNDIVLDIFGGSGSTLIACEQLDRVCYISELDPRYCDVIIDRWETLTGEKAVLISGDNQPFEAA